MHNGYSHTWRIACASLTLISGMTATTCNAEDEHVHPEGFKPSANLGAFYADPERRAEITIHSSNPLHTVPRHFMGINTSYFNDTDEIWKNHNVRAKLKKAGVGALRYPGGEESSFFHWEHPGVNGYEDLWDDPKQYGYSPKRGPFQSTWVDPGKWATNENFMNFDEFMAHCSEIGAEPIVGLNLSSGAKHNRQKEGVEEALRWMRYCKEKGYQVKYWFLDNEPWNFEAAYQMYVKPYAAECVRYGKAIKAEFPDVKLIANPCSTETYNAWDEVEYFVREAGGYVDYFDIHTYWEWGRSSFERWKDTTPLQTGDKWKNPDLTRTYAEDFRRLREIFAKAGHPNMGIVVLEWNVAPSAQSPIFSESMNALIQSELLMEFLLADVHMTCLWPLLWRTSRDVWAEQDPFQSIITQDPPLNETLSLEMFRMFSPVQGTQLFHTESSSSQDLVVLTSRSQDNTCWKLLVLSKSELRRKVTFRFDHSLPATTTDLEYISLKNQVCMQQKLEPASGESFTTFIEPLSFNVITLKKNPGAKKP
jgi:hypothetical protein